MPDSYPQSYPNPTLDPTCSVIVLNWNGRHHLSVCLESIRLQTYTDKEVILVDNGSTDGSQDFVRSEFPWVRLLLLGRNEGFCAGNNAGIRSSRGKYVVLLNNDTELEPDWLAELVAAAEAAPEAGSFASQMRMYDRRDTLDAAGIEYATCGVAAKRGCLAPSRDYGNPVSVFGASAGAALYRRTMLDHIGLLDENFFLIFEDVDLSFRAQLAGYPCRYIPGARMYHKVNATIGRYSAQYVFYGHRNLEFVYLKNMPAKLLARTLPAHLFYDFAALLFFASRRRLGSFLRAKLAVLRALPLIWRQRRVIQASRRVPDQTIELLLTSTWLRQRWAKW